MANYLTRILAPFTLSAALISGCAGTGYRSPYQNKAIQESFEKQEYNAKTIDFFAQREFAFINDKTKEFEVKYPSQKSFIDLLNTYKLPTATATNALDKEILSQNAALMYLFENNKIQRWLLQSAKKNAEFNYEFTPLSDEENKKIKKQLDTLVISANNTSFSKRNTWSPSKDLKSSANYNHEGLLYLIEILTAKADIESQEFHIYEINKANKTASALKNSVEGLNEFAIGNSVFFRISQTKVGSYFTGTDELIKQTNISLSQTLGNVYLELLNQAKKELDEKTYSSKHKAYQGAFSHLLSLPLELLQKNHINQVQASALKKKIISDITELFEKNKFEDEQDISLKQIGFSALPIIGLFDFEDWRNCFTFDWFEPNESSPEKSYAAIIKEGRRLNCANGSSDKFIGSTNAAIKSRTFAATSSALAIATAYGLASNKNGRSINSGVSSQPITPPIGGGGTITPGTRN